MKSKVLKITATGSWNFEEVEGTQKEPIGLKTLQKAVAGFVECYGLDDAGFPDVDLWLNEEGKLRGLPINILATFLSGIYRYGDRIVGDVLVCARNGAGGSVGLNAEQESVLREALKKEEGEFNAILEKVIEPILGRKRV